MGQTMMARKSSVILIQMQSERVMYARASRGCDDGRAFERSFAAAALTLLPLASVTISYVSMTSILPSFCAAPAAYNCENERTAHCSGPYVLERESE